MEDVWDEAKDNHHHVAFVFEDERSLVGIQVIDSFVAHLLFLYLYGITFILLLLLFFTFV